MSEEHRKRKKSTPKKRISWTPKRTVMVEIQEAAPKKPSKKRKTKSSARGSH